MGNAMADIKRFEEYGNRTANDYVADLVSVITPVYNVEKYLKQSIESVLAQTYPHIEMILVDDCSKDNSAEIVRKYQQNYPRIKYYLLPHNMGAGYARNKALEIARGRYVAFLDADDVWQPEKIERQIKLMKEKKSPFSYTAIEMVDEDDILIKEKRKITKSIDYNILLVNTMIATSTVLIDRMVLGDFRMHLRRGGQDYATWLKLLRGGVVAVGVDDALVKYRVTNNSLSSKKYKSVVQIWEIQTQEEKINNLTVLKNIILWMYSSIKKYYF